MRKFIGLLLLVFISLSAFPAATAMDGVQGGQIEETVQIPLTPGAGDVVVQWEDTALGRHAVPHDTWGSSYATSKEIAWLRYVGTARAAGNVYAGQRIVGVCIWYTRNGVMKSYKGCSNATRSSSGWVMGPVMIVETWDTIDPNAPKTIFNIQTTRINPNIF